MKQTFPYRNINIPKLLRTMGYHPILDRRSAQESWSCTLGRGHYPRFHLYISEKSSTVVFKLHLDQKQATIKVAGMRRHGGEYNGAVVEQEMARIGRWMQYALAGGRI